MDATVMSMGFFSQHQSCSIDKMVHSSFKNEITISTGSSPGSAPSCCLQYSSVSIGSHFQILNVLAFHGFHIISCSLITSVYCQYDAIIIMIHQCMLLVEHDARQEYICVPSALLFSACFNYFTNCCLSTCPYIRFRTKSRSSHTSSQFKQCHPFVFACVLQWGVQINTRQKFGRTVFVRDLSEQ